jgi:hypothetical protein
VEAGAQHDGRHAAAREVPLGAPVVLPERRRRADLGADGRELHEPPHPGRVGRVDRDALELRLPRLVAARQEHGVHPRERAPNGRGVGEVADRQLDAAA